MIYALAAPAAEQAQGTNPMGGIGGTVVYMVILIAFFYFVLIRPQKKREKETRMMLNDMRQGDEVVTIGGIMGNILAIKDDRVLLETGANRTKLTIEKSAIKTVLTVHEDEEEYEEETEE